jgi:hypothetical protein
MGRRVWMWRRRNNPLCRRSYLLEAWALLGVGTLGVTAAALTGLAVSRSVQHHLAQQRAERHPVTAVLLEDASDVPGYASQPRAQVRWTAPDGSRHTGRAKVNVDLESGARITVWTDSNGELAPAPASGSAAHAEALATGAAAAGTVAALALAAFGIATQLADRRRADQWAAEWAVIGPQWDRRKA